MVDNRYILIGILALVALFIWYRRSSGFIVTPDLVPLTLMDLQEFSYLRDAQKTAYRSSLMQASTMLTSNVTDYGKYIGNIQTLLNNVIRPGATEIPPPVSVCTGVIVMGDCLTMDRASAVCRSPAKPTPVGTQQYCMCPTTQPFARMSTTVSTTGVVLMCSQTPCATTEHTITEAATGQRMCVSQCPSPARAGYTCV